MRVFFLLIILCLSACAPASSIDDTFLGGVKFSAERSTISISANSVIDGGSVTITVRAYDENGNSFYVPRSSPVISFSLSGGTSAGAFSAVVNHHDGSYTATFTGSTAGSPALVAATFEGKRIPGTVSIQVINSATAPSGLAAAGANGSVSLTWNNIGGVTGFNVLRGTSAGALTQIATSATNSYTDSTAVNGTAYYYAVQSVSSGGTSANSALAQAKPLAQPSISSVAVSGAGAMLVSWSGSTGAESYAVKYSTTSGSASSGTTGCTVTVPTLSCTVSGLTAGTTYFFSAVAINSVGSGGSAASAESPGIPLAAFSMTAVSAGVGSATATWASAAGQTSYDILYDTVSRAASGSYASAVSGVSSGASVSSLSTGTTYYFRVRANNSYGSILSTNELSSAVLQSFSLNLPFTAGSESSYSISDSARLELSGGVARLKPASQTDDDNSASKFGAATLNGVQWDASYLRLNTATNLSELDSSWTPQWSNVTGYWKLDGSGTIANSEPIAGTVGSSLGLVSSGTGLQYAAGRIGTSISFGLSSYLTAPTSASLDSTNKLSVAFWVRPTTLDGTARAVVCKRITVNNNESYCFFFYTGNKFFVDIDGSDNRFTTNTVFSTNKWYHIVVVYDGSLSFGDRVAVYVNGTLDKLSGESTTSIPSYNSTFEIGRMQGAGFFVGNIDEVAFWKGASLTATEVQAIFQRQLAKFSGSATARVMDSLATAQSWESLAAVTTLPFSKELPSSAASESSSEYSASGGNLTNGLAGYWRFNESAYNATSGEVIDSSGSGRHATASGTTTNSIGRLNNGANFTGSTYAQTDSWDFGAIQNLTFSTWVKLPAGTPAAKSGLLYKGGSATFELGIAATGAVYNCINVSSWSCHTFPTVYSDWDQWHHLAQTFDGSTVALYRDGALVATRTLSGTIAASNSPLQIGITSDAIKLSGMMDEAAVWARTLSAAEIKELYRRGANRIKYQVRSCENSDCSDQEGLTANFRGWKGPGGDGLSYFSELYNTTNNILGGTVLASAPNMDFTKFGSLTVAARRFFQYRAILESDDQNSLCSYGNCSPELKAVSIGPTHYDTAVQSIVSAAGIGSAYNSIDANGFTATLGTGGCASGAKFAISRDGSTFHYYNGTNWVSSSDYSSANDAATMKANISTFPAAIGTGTIQVKTFLKSNGTSACELDNINITGKKF